MENRAVIISGATSGIGEALVRRFADRGYGIVLNARSEDRLRKLELELIGNGGKISAVAGDASELATVQKMIDTCRASFGVAPDLCVVNAGRGLPGTITTSDENNWDEVFRINTLGAMRQMRLFAEAMEQDISNCPKSRDIVVLGSTVGRNVSPTNSVYGASKFAVHGAAEALRRELGPKGIRVSLVQPGIVVSNFQDSAGYDAVGFAEYARSIGPVLSPEDVASAIEFVTAQPWYVNISDIILRPTRQDYP